ncbi:uncharacterized protein LOC125220426 [Salvia hispanica]|uniref:uncharacterized protein LOC125220426 n=1 Tax=Salvia hispanica TaxID=49212 RepID=UPI002009CD44|nr:uncharacterized protein LOC125220426 [Salvia hispanica]
MEVEEVVVLLWHLWFNENKIIWRNENVSAAGIIGAACSCLTAWREAQVQNDIGALGGRLHLEGKWVKPWNGVLKFNIDTAVFESQRKIGCRAVVRDFEGIVVAAMCGKVGRVAGPSMVDLLSLRDVLSWVKRKGWKEMEFEMDVQTVVLVVTGLQKDDSIFGAVVEDYRQLLKEASGSSMRFVRRSTNQVVNTLARASSSIAESKFC